MSTFPSALRLPFQFDVERLTADLSAAEQYQWPQHYNSKDYEGSWTSLSLRSADGEMSNVYALPTESFHDTPLMAECPYMAWIMGQFQCPKLTVRLLRLEAGSVIKAHRDPGLSYAEGEFRVHVPILTHDKVEFVVDGERIPMRAGECWYADFTKPHSVANLGSTPRVHLVLDCVRNAWTDALFLAQGYDPALAIVEEKRTPQEMRSMIQSYRSSGNPMLMNEADELERKLEGID